MDHELILRYLGTLGFPICMSMGFAFALWKIGGRLLDSHLALVENLKTNTVAQTALGNDLKIQGIQQLQELKHQTTLLAEQSSILKGPLCKAKL